MTRRIAFAYFLGLSASCSRQKHSLKDMLPVQVQRAWTLQTTRPLDSGEVPELLRNLGVEQSMEASYAGNGSIKVRVYQMSGGASAFEAMQKWRQEEGLAFERGPFFVTVQGDSVDRQALLGFLQGLNAEIKVPG